MHIVDPKLHQSMHDPACVKAGFLLAAWEHMKKHPRARDRAVYSALTGKFSGIDIVLEAVRLAAISGTWVSSAPDRYCNGNDAACGHDADIYASLVAPITRRRFQAYAMTLYRPDPDFQLLPKA